MPPSGFATGFFCVAFLCGGSVAPRSYDDIDESNTGIGAGCDEPARAQAPWERLESGAVKSASQMVKPHPSARLGTGPTSLRPGFAFPLGGGSRRWAGALWTPFLLRPWPSSRGLRTRPSKRVVRGSRTCRGKKERTQSAGAAFLNETLCPLRSRERELPPESSGPILYGWSGRPALDGRGAWVGRALRSPLRAVPSDPARSAFLNGTHGLRLRSGLYMEITTPDSSTMSATISYLFRFPLVWLHTTRNQTNAITGFLFAPSCSRHRR